MPRSSIVKKSMVVVLSAVLTFTFAACSISVSKPTPSSSAAGSSAPWFFGTSSEQPSAAGTKPTVPASVLPSAAASATPKTPKNNDSEVVENAKNVIVLANSGDYSKLYGMFRDDVQKLMTSDSLKTVIGKALSAAGKFVTYKDTETGSGTSKQWGDFVGAAISSQYQNEDLLFTISFDKDMKPIGVNVQHGGLATDNHDLKTIIKSAESVIDTLNSGNYSAIYNLSVDELKQQYSADKFKAMFEPLISAAGKFSGFTDTKTGVSLTISNGSYIAAQITAHYASKDIVYVIKFDQAVKLESLSVM